MCNSESLFVNTCHPNTWEVEASGLGVYVSLQYGMSLGSAWDTGDYLKTKQTEAGEMTQLPGPMVKRKNNSQKGFVVVCFLRQGFSV